MTIKNVPLFIASCTLMAIAGSIAVTIPDKWTVLALIFMAYTAGFGSAKS